MIYFVPKIFLTAPLVRDVIVADILPSLADEEEDRRRTDEGRKTEMTATETENITHINLSGYRIMVQTIRGMIPPSSSAPSISYFYNHLALDNYLIPYKFDKNEHFQTWLGAQLSRFTFSNPNEEEGIYQDIYDRRFVCLKYHGAQNSSFCPYSNKRESKSKELQLVRDVWEHTISGSLDGLYTITRCSEEALQLLPQEQPVKAKSLRSLLSCKKSS